MEREKSIYRSVRELSPGIEPESKGSPAFMSYLISLQSPSFVLQQSLMLYLVTSHHSSRGLYTMRAVRW